VTVERQNEPQVKLWPNGYGIGLTLSPPKDSDIYFTSVYFGHKLSDITNSIDNSSREEKPTIWVYEVYDDLNTTTREPSEEEVLRLLRSVTNHFPNSEYSKMLKTLIKSHS